MHFKSPITEMKILPRFKFITSNIVPKYAGQWICYDFYLLKRPKKEDNVTALIILPGNLLLLYQQEEP